MESTLRTWGHSNEEVATLVEGVEVPCSSFEQLLESNGVEKLDVLAMDVEGMDFALLKTFPFTKVQPRVIIFEGNHLSAEERAAVPGFLTENGYSFMEFGIDVFCKRW